MMAEAYTTANWLAELEALGLGDGDAEGMTSGEIAKAAGVSEREALRLLKAAKAAGRLVTGRARREAVDGMLRWSPVYRIARSGE